MSFNFDFDIPKIEFVKIDICGLVQKLKSKKKHLFAINREVSQIEALISNPPTENDCFKMLSVSGGFSSISIIKYVAEKETIKELYASTFRIGEKQFLILNKLYKDKKLNKVHLITSTTQKNTDKVYNYYEHICKVCKDNEWELKVFNNHSKLILMKTDKNFYVVETSSNLNENPKIEQFSWENDKTLYLWYEKFFVELLKLKGE